MILKLVTLPNTLQGPSGDDYHGQVPARARLAAPDAQFSTLGDLNLVYTDIFRSAAASLAAMGSKRGVQAPGYSGHGYGLSFDLDIDACCKDKSYFALCRALEDRGWFCHRRDGQRGSEDWHFNWFGLISPSLYLGKVEVSDPATWSRAIEYRICERYGDQFAPTPAQIQVALTSLGFYHGILDGQLGHESFAAIQAFQHAWKLVEDGIAGPRTQRTLAYVSAGIEINGVTS